MKELDGRLGRLGLVMALGGWGAMIFLQELGMVHWIGYALAGWAIVAGSWLWITAGGPQ